MTEGERRYVALGWSLGLECPTGTEDAYAQDPATSHYWREWLAGGSFPDHRWRTACSARR